MCQLGSWDEVYKSQGEQAAANKPMYYTANSTSEGKCRAVLVLLGANITEHGAVWDASHYTKE